MSRSKYSIYNASSAIVFFILVLLSTLFFRKAFSSHLGDEILGLNTTLTNLISFLNLAELGIGASVTFFLYKPFKENDNLEIFIIYNILKKIYFKIGFFILVIGFLVTFFLQYIFKSSDLASWIIYSTYLVLFFSTLFSYFFNYKQIIFLADQKNYINIWIFQGIKFLKLVIQTICIVFSKYGFILWLFLEISYPVLTTIILNVYFKTDYKFLQNKSYDLSLSFKKSEEYLKTIMKKTNQLFFHKLAGFILIQGSPVLVFLYTNFREVAVYGNYLVILTGLTSIITMIFTSITSSIGNYIVSKSANDVYQLYKQIQLTELFIVSSCSICFYFLANRFMQIWMGKDYLFPESTVLLMALFIYLSLIRINDVFLTAYGLFKDIYAPVAELLINFIISSILGYFWGINGILVGINVSLICILFVWKPYFINREIFKRKLIDYYIPIVKNIGFILSILLLCRLVHLQDYTKAPIPSDLMVLIILLITNSVVFFAQKDFRTFLKRFF